jgi:hypothetical protein
MRGDARDLLAELEAEENGPCDSCDLEEFGGIRSHEEFCRRYENLMRQRRAVVRNGYAEE